MNFDDLFPSKFLKADDCMTNKVMIIQSITQEEVGADKEIKPILRFVGENRGLVLNRVNGSMLQMLHGNSVDAWVGKQIELYRDLVQFGGKTVPAIRLRQPPPAPQQQAAVAPAVLQQAVTPAAPDAGLNDDITF